MKSETALKKEKHPQRRFKQDCTIFGLTCLVQHISYAALSPPIITCMELA